MAEGLASLHEVENVWTLADVARGNRVLDSLADAREREAKKKR